MRRAIIVAICALLLFSCSSMSSFFQDDESMPTWAKKAPEREGYVSFVSEGVGAEEEIAKNDAMSGVLEDVSAYLGYDVRNRYYREFIAVGSVTDLSLSVAESEYDRESGISYVLAYADKETIEGLVSEERKALLERDESIRKLLSQAVSYYREYDDIETINCYLRAIRISSEGPVSNPEHEKENLLERATKYLDDIELKVSGRDRDKAEATVHVKRKRGLVHPPVVSAVVNATFPVRAHGGGEYDYTVRFISDKKGKFRFSRYYTRMKSAGRVVFSLAITDELESAIGEIGEEFFSDFLRLYESKTASFDYSISYSSVDDGIILSFEEYSDMANLRGTSFARDAAIKQLEDDGISVGLCEVDLDDFDETVGKVREDYPGYRYFVIARIGIREKDFSEKGDLILTGEGYLAIVDLSDGSTLFSEENMLKHCWGKREEEIELTDSLFQAMGSSAATLIMTNLE